MKTFYNILKIIFFTLILFTLVSQLLDLSGKRAYLRECKIHPWTCK